MDYDTTEAIEREAHTIRGDMWQIDPDHVYSMICQVDDCPNPVDRYPQFCNDHGPEVYGVEVRPSTLPGAGLGLFATVDIPSEESIDLYCGRVFDLEDKRPRRYGLKHPTESYGIDSLDTQSCVSRYANHAPRGQALCNCYLQILTEPGSSHTHLILQTSRTIQQGEELCFDYGSELQGFHFFVART